MNTSVARTGRVPGHVRKTRAGRVCVVVGCSTVLSVYNAEPFCWSHQSPLVTRPGNVLRG